MGANQRIKVLIADSDGQQSRHLSEVLSKKGFSCRIATSTAKAEEMIQAWKPRVVLIDLMLPPKTAIGLLNFIQKNRQINSEFISLLVISGHNNKFNVKQCFERGAVDYLVRPISQDDIAKRIAFHCKGQRRLKEINKSDLKKVNDKSLMLHLTDLILKQALVGTNLTETLFQLTKMLNLKMSGVRCSVVHCRDVNHGTVIASNDDRSATGLKIDLEKYPEIRSVISSQQMFVVENINKDKRLSFISSLLKDIRFSTLVVCPIYRKQSVFGVMSLRLPISKSPLRDDELRFIGIVSRIMSLVLNGEKTSNINDLIKKSA